MSYCSNPLYLIQSIVKSSNCGASATNSPTASLTALSTSSGILSGFSFKTFTVRSYIPVDEKDEIHWQNKKYRIISVEHRKELSFNGILIRTELINE